MNIRDFLEILEKYRKRLTRQQYKTVRGQAYDGDILSALRGLKKLTEVGR